MAVVTSLSMRATLRCVPELASVVRILDLVDSVHLCREARLTFLAFISLRSSFAFSSFTFTFAFIELSFTFAFVELVLDRTSPDPIWQPTISLLSLHIFSDFIAQNSLGFGSP